MLAEMTAKPLTPQEQNELLAAQSLWEHVNAVGHSDWCEFVTSGKQASCSCGAAPGWRPNRLIEQSPK